MNRRGVALVLAVVVSVVLVGCASAAPKITPTASSTRTPTPTAAAAPKLRVPLACASLFTPSVVATFVDTAVTVKQDESASLTSFSDVVSAQNGNTTVVANTAGDQSEYHCNSADGFDCSGNMLVGSYWLTAVLQEYGGKTVTQGAANDRMQQVLGVVANALSSAKVAGAAWVPPTNALPTFCAATASTSQVRSATESPGLNVSADERLTVFDASNIAQSDRSFATCYWKQSAATAPSSQFYDLRISLLRGGNWALPKLVTSLPTNWYFGTYRAVSIPGATAAILACNNADCDAIVGVGSDAVEVDLANFGTPRVTSALTSLVKAIAHS